MNNIFRTIIDIAKGNKFRYTKKFQFENKNLQLFEHNYNIGVLKNRMTERAFEMAIADKWLIGKTSVCEVGAVSPYYWPGRIQRVIDPYDPHEAVTDKASLFDTDYTNLDILSISTIEHVGTGDYNLSKNESAQDALEMIINQARTFLITIPLGYNKILDEYIYNNKDRFKDILSVYSRNIYDNRWKRDPLIRNDYQYGPQWANSLAIFIDNKSRSAFM